MTDTMRQDKNLSSPEKRPSRRRGLIVGTAGLVVVAVLTTAGILWRHGEVENLRPPKIKADYPVSTQNGTVLVGNGSAKTTIDIYEDFLCAYCGQFERDNGMQLERELNKGSLQIRYRLLPFLARVPKSEQYSMRAANAALCAADSGRFMQYHAALFWDQPPEGGPTYNDEKLIQFGRNIGVADQGFVNCIHVVKYRNVLQSNLNTAMALPHLKVKGPKGRLVFRGTPSVTVGQKLVDTDKKQWLAGILG